MNDATRQAHAAAAIVEGAGRSAIGTGSDGSKLAAANQKVINQFRGTNADSSRQFRKKGGARRMERAVEGLNSQLGSVRQEAADMPRRLIAGPGIALRKVGDKVLVSARPAPVTFYGRGRVSAAAAGGGNHPFKVLTQGGQWGIYHDSHLFGSLRPDDDVAITGLLSEDLSTGWRDMDTGDAIWLKVEFDAFLAVVAVTVESWGDADAFDVTLDAWAANAYVEDDGGGPAVQLYARCLIAQTGAADTTVRQSVRTDLVLRNANIDGVPARILLPHAGGYVS